MPPILCGKISCLIKINSKFYDLGFFRRKQILPGLLATNVYKKVKISLFNYFMLGYI